MGSRLFDVSISDSHGYPYPISFHIYKEYTDSYKRDPHKLMTSLTRFGDLIMNNEIQYQDENSVDMVPVISRFCKDATLEEDFDTILKLYPPPRHDKRLILQPILHRINQKVLTQQLAQIATYEQIVIPHCQAKDKWVIYLVSMLSSSVNEYWIGDVEYQDVAIFIVLISNILNSHFPNRQFKYKESLQVAHHKTMNTVDLALILSRYLHEHGNYLELRTDMVLHHKLSILSPRRDTSNHFIRHHDRWFGDIEPKTGDRPWPPFVTAVNADNNLPELQELSWAVMDVVGDGNCGYYSLILGLENNGVLTYNPRLQMAQDRNSAGTRVTFQ